MSIYRDDTLEWITACADVLDENSNYLTKLDAAIGEATMVSIWIADLKRSC